MGHIPQEVMFSSIKANSSLSIYAR